MRSEVTLQHHLNKSLRRGSAISQVCLTFFVEEKLWEQPLEAVHGAFDTDLNSNSVFPHFSEIHPATIVSLASTIKKTQAFISFQCNIYFSFPS